MFHLLVMEPLDGGHEGINFTMLEFLNSKHLARQLRTTFNSSDELSRQSHHPTHTHNFWCAGRSVA